MDDDLFSSFTAKPPAAGPSSQRAAPSTASSSSGAKRPVSPSAPQAPVDKESLKKLKTSETGATSTGASLLVPATTDRDDPSPSTLEREREQAFAVTDEMEITAQTKVKGSAGLQGDGAAPDAQKDGAEDEGLILSHQVSFRTRSRSPLGSPCPPLGRVGSDENEPTRRRGSSNRIMIETKFTDRVSHRSATKSPSLPTIPTFQSRRTCPPPNQPARTRSSWIRSRKFPSRRSSATSLSWSLRTLRPVKPWLPSMPSRNVSRKARGSSTPRQSRFVPARVSSSPDLPAETSLVTIRDASRLCRIKSTVKCWPSLETSDS